MWQHIVRLINIFLYTYYRKSWFHRGASFNLLLLISMGSHNLAGSSSSEWCSGCPHTQSAASFFSNLNIPLISTLYLQVFWELAQGGDSACICDDQVTVADRFFTQLLMCPLQMLQLLGAGGPAVRKCDTSQHLQDFENIPASWEKEKKMEKLHSIKCFWWEVTDWERTLKIVHVQEATVVTRDE